MSSLRRHSVLAAICLAAFSYGQRPATTVEGTRKLLLGDHLLSLQWVSWDHFGKATVSEKSGRLSLQGEQRKGGDYVTVDGVIKEILPRGFRFDGVIKTRVSHINQGKDCVRKGEFTFLASGSRKYWRMQQMKNPCDEATDYVDVYFKRP